MGASRVVSKAKRRLDAASMHIYTIGAICPYTLKDTITPRAFPHADAEDMSITFYGLYEVGRAIYEGACTATIRALSPVVERLRHGKISNSGTQISYHQLSQIPEQTEPAHRSHSISRSQSAYQLHAAIRMFFEVTGYAPGGFT